MCGGEGAQEAPGAVSALASLFCCWVTSVLLHAGAAAARELCAELTFGGLSCRRRAHPGDGGAGREGRRRGREVQICTAGLSGRHGNASGASLRESP